MSTQWQCNEKHLDACLPVTALCPFELGGKRLVLHGSGPTVSLTEEKTGRIFSQVRAFQRHNVHGIASTGWVEPCHATFLAWGGSSVRLIRVRSGQGGASESYEMSNISHEYCTPDWILDAGFPESQEGSTIRAALLTAHNVLLGLDFDLHASDKPVKLRIRELAAGLKSVLYSADVAWVSSKQVLVAAGTVFGEIVVWSCFLSNDSLKCSYTAIHHFYEGHEGSIFGVDISTSLSVPGEQQPRRLLASCSDDRTIRVWDISDCSSDTAASIKPDLSEGHSTGFGNSIYRDDIQANPEGCIAVTYGHISRIWGVKFLDTLWRDEELQFNLLSRGEDSTTQLWTGVVKGSPGETEDGRGFQSDGTLNHVLKREFHSGKNVWSFATFTNNTSTDVYSGGADGTIISYSIPSISSRDCSSDDESTKQSELDGKAYSRLQPDQKLTRYGFVSNTHILAVSTQGEVLIGTISDSETQTSNVVQDASAVSWNSIGTFDGLKNHAVLSSDPTSGVAILCGMTGQVFLYDHAAGTINHITQADPRVAGIWLMTGKQEMSSLVFMVSYMGRNEAHLFFVPIASKEEGQKKLCLSLPAAFVITAAEYIWKDGWLVVGGRTGGIVLFNVSNPRDENSPCIPASSIERVHGKDTVTSITSLTGPQNASEEYALLTTGRDSQYAIHTLTEVGGSFTFTTIHRSSPSLSSIEGAYIDEATKDLILYGFRSTQFTIYNESNQSLISSVECGGAHRTWAFNHAASIEGRKTFLWTRASTFNMSSRIGLVQRAVKIGGHGREIKTMATCPVQYSVNDVPRTIIATGAEDTTIRLFAYTPELKDEKQGSFKCALTLRKHTTGLQHLQFSQCGRFLFSSGGLEETYVWRVRSIPGLGLGAVLEAQCPKSTPKSDLRVMTFDVLNLESEDDTASFLLALAYSNSEVKVFMYSTPTTGGQGTFTLIAQGHYKSNCLTQLKFILSQPAISLLSASTDGHVALWSITEAVSPFLSFTQDSGLLKRPDDNHRESAETALISWHSSYMIHQNSIKALDLLVVDRDGTPGTPQSRRRAEDVIIVTGGDDNALAVTRISVGQGRDSYPHSVSYVSPDRSDHAAAINDVLLLRYAAATTSTSEAKKLELQFASSGNDQQLKVFNVTLGLADDGTLKAECKCLSDKYTAVADVASLGRVDPVASKAVTDETNQATNSIGVLVCGVGMDMWGFD